MVNDPNTVRKGLNDTLAKHFMTSGFDNNRDLQKLNKFIQNWGEAIDDSSKAYKNAVMLNLLDEAHMNKAALLGMNAKGSAFGLATAQMHAKQSFIMSGSMAGEFLPLIKAIVHIIIAIMSVFLIMLSIMFMQPMFVKTFVTLNLWIVFWSPLIAIINFIMIYNIEKVVNYVKSQGYDPFSVLGSNMLDGKILDYLAYEGTLAWLVPILAFAIASGSAQGFVAFASSLGQQFASASMMGARQVTGMATQGSQSIRDGNSTYTKDGSGITRLTTSIAGGQKVDYAIKYGNTDKAQEVEARGTNFSYKTDAEAMMMTGRFDNLALNNAMSSGTNSGQNEASSYKESHTKNENYSYTKSGGHNGSGTTTKTHNDTNQDSKVYSENNDITNKNTNTSKTNNVHTTTHEQATQVYQSVGGGGGFGSPGSHTEGEGQNKTTKPVLLNGSVSVQGGVNTSETTKVLDNSSMENSADKSKGAGNTITGGHDQNKSVGTTNADARQLGDNFSENYQISKSGGYSKVQGYEQTNNYGTSQSENTSLSHNSVAATMNAKMIASGMSGMSFEERLNYLSTQMAEMGNMSALSKDVGAMNDKLDAGIQGVTNNVNKDIGLSEFRKEQAQTRKQAEHYQNKVLNKKVQDTHLSAFATNLDENGNILGKNGKILMNKEQVENWEKQNGKTVTELANGQGKVKINGEEVKVVSDYNTIFKNENLGNKTQGDMQKADVERHQKNDQEYQRMMENLENASFPAKALRNMGANIDLLNGEGAMDYGAKQLKKLKFW